MNLICYPWCKPHARPEARHGHVLAASSIPGEVGDASNRSVFTSWRNCSSAGRPARKSSNCPRDEIVPKWRGVALLYLTFFSHYPSGRLIHLSHVVGGATATESVSPRNCEHFCRGFFSPTSRRSRY
jgi:hypothetical protein